MPESLLLILFLFAIFLPVFSSFNFFLYIHFNLLGQGCFLWLFIQLALLIQLWHMATNCRILCSAPASGDVGAMALLFCTFW